MKKTKEELNNFFFFFFFFFRSPLTSEKPWKNCRMSAVVAVKGRPRMITKVPAARPGVLLTPPAAAAAAAAATTAAGALAAEAGP